MPTPGDYKAYTDSIVSFAKSQAKNILIREVSKRLPFLFLGPLNAVTTLVLAKIVEILFREAEFLVFYGYVELRTNKQGQEFSKAIINYHKAIKDETVSDESKKKSEELLISKFREFVAIR